ncbi:glycosyltransferase family 4 protein [Methanosarcina sp. UBA411]|jgi:glycosyltransferase involved in cell wall biosynthesis|uniref:glycosyltransferase family 4 protein n=1 Tax=Methanosarcina sp. UBA411 TaxID=1915589 RepID=UPI0025EFFAF7|nr:glycosyltransferase family 4 protein [Methanosarcina sp. UBA411]
MEIHQILPTISPGDAIGNEAQEIKRVLNEWGYKSEIYAQNIHPKINAKKYTEYKKISSKENILIFHFSIGSEVSEFVKKLPDKKIMIYHNITPPEYFCGVNETLVNLLENGKKELRSLVDHIDLAVGVSEYNRLELQEMGFKNTDVLPIIINFHEYSSPNKKLLSKYDDDFVNFLFVGRVTPHKRQEDVIKVFYYYKLINPKSRLFLAGSYEGCEIYSDYLKKLIQELNLKDVHLLGKISFNDLISYYKLADIFICMSEHEGFCVPILESMYFEVPIIAYKSTAIPFTLEDTGILVKEKNYCEIAEMVNVLIEDEELRSNFVKKQKDRLENFKREKIISQLESILSKVK